MSYLHDRAGHGSIGKQNQFVDSKIPPSIIPKTLRVVEKSPFPPENFAYQTTFDGIHLGKIFFIVFIFILFRKV